MTPRRVALGLGVGYVGLTALELMIGQWAVGEVTILERTTKANLLHWAVALAMLGGFFGGASRVVLRSAGLVLIGIAAWGLLSASSLGGLLGFPDSIPGAYNAYHGLTGAIALSGGFLRR